MAAQSKSGERAIIVLFAALLASPLLNSAISATYFAGTELGALESSIDRLETQLINTELPMLGENMGELKVEICALQDRVATVELEFKILKGCIPRTPGF